MEDVERIYSLLLHSKGLKIREIAKELDLEKYYVAEVLFSAENISYWYQDDYGLWFAKEGAIQIEEAKGDHSQEPHETQNRFNYERYLQGTPSDTLRSYIYNISKYSVYSNEETLELIRRFKKGDKKALDLLVKSQQRLVVGIAFLYCKDGVQLEDLIQEGNIGLIRAIERFDYSQSGSSFNYLKSYVIQAISYSMTFMPYTVRLPLSHLIQYRKIHKCIEKYEQLHGYSPSPYDIKLDEDIDIKRISFLLQLPDNIKDIVCVDDIDNYESNFLIADFIYESLCKEIDRALSTLTQREQTVIRLYFGLNGNRQMALEEIGMKFDLTRERVRQIKEKAIRRLKHSSRNKTLKTYLEYYL